MLRSATVRSARCRSMASWLSADLMKRAAKSRTASFSLASYSARMASPGAVSLMRTRLSTMHVGPGGQGLAREDLPLG